MLVFFCGNLNSGQLVPTFTEIHPTNQTIDIVNIAVFQNHILAFDRNFSDISHTYVEIPRKQERV